MTQSSDELRAFHAFLGERLKGEGPQLSPEESVEAFRAYRDELDRLREDLRPALEQAARGEAREIDFDAFKREARERLAEEGITD